MPEMRACINIQACIYVRAHTHTYIHMHTHSWTYTNVRTHRHTDNTNNRHRHIYIILLTDAFTLQPCHVVYTDYRPVPLQHYLFPAGADGLYLVVDEKVHTF